MRIKYTLILLIVFCTNVYAQKENPFDKMVYDSVVIYDFDWRGESEEYFSIIDEKNELARTVKKSKILTEKESKNLSVVLGLKSSYGEGSSACFLPHLGIVYYKNGNAAAHVTICMGCNILESSIEIPNQKQGKQESEEGDIYYTQMGMSKSLKKHLDKLLKKYSFSHRPQG